MSAPQFPEGPWEVRSCVNRLGHVTSLDICPPINPDAPGGPVYASVYSGEVTARLIAAAPELYEAAKYALGVIGTTNRFDPEQCAAACSALEAALAKARGEGK